MSKEMAMTTLANEFMVHVGAPVRERMGAADRYYIWIHDLDDNGYMWGINDHTKEADVLRLGVSSNETYSWYAGKLTAENCNSYSALYKSLMEQCKRPSVEG